MPFSGQYDDTFLVAIQPSALALKAAAERVDHAGRSGDVVQQIREMIKTAQVVVADLSESRPNVCHEVGYAEALGKPVVQICATPVANLPFNLRNNQTIAYQIGQASRLRTKLERQLAKIL
jgi:nucleoside 2-deoxyribosyltransferase